MWDGIEKMNFYAFEIHPGGTSGMKE